MRRFTAALWPDVEKVPSVMAQIAWSPRQLRDSFADQPALYAWNAARSAENRWSERHLKAQIDLRPHERH
jgi:hypothetical protein